MSKNSGTPGPAKGAKTAITAKRPHLQDSTTTRRPGRPTTSATPSARPPSATSRGPPTLTKALPNGRVGRAELGKFSCPAQLAKPSSSQECSQSGQLTQKLSTPFTLAKASRNSQGGKVKLGIARSNQEGHQTMEGQGGWHQTGPKDITSSNSNLPTSAAKRLCQATPTATPTPPRVNIKNNPGVHIHQAEAKVVQATIKQL